MPIALKHHLHRNATRSVERATINGDASAAPPTAHRTQRVDSLNALLESAPIDLAAISEEIRRRPELEAQVVRLGRSLGLSSDETVNCVEDAVVVLGAQRLRVVIDLWAMRPNGAARLSPITPGADAPAVGNPGAPEVEYLERLLRRLSDEAATPGAAGDRLSILTDCFMQDFFSLLPVIQPNMAPMMERLRHVRGDAAVR